MSSSEFARDKGGRSCSPTSVDGVCGTWLVLEKDGRGFSPSVGGACDAVLSLDKDGRSFSLTPVGGACDAVLSLDRDGRGFSLTPVGGACDAVLVLDKEGRSFSLSSVTWSAGGAGRSSFPWVLCCSLFFNTQYTSPQIFSKMV